MFESQVLHRKSLVFKGGRLWNEVERPGKTLCPFPWVVKVLKMAYFPGFELSAVNLAPGTN